MPYANPDLRRICEIWQGMKRRCYNPNYDRYADYGGRGIRVCDEWFYSQTAFQTWALTNGYGPDLQIDRINNDADYSPDNCRWVTPNENRRKRRDTIRRSFFGEEMTLAEAARKFKMSHNGLKYRIFVKGMTPEEAVTVERTAGQKWRGGGYSHRTRLDG